MAMRRARFSWFMLLLVLLLAPGVAWGQLCPPVPPTPCTSCFAVFVMPDTQNYTRRTRQPQGAAHLDLVTRYICDHRTAWTEPSTGKQMPILMVIQLGDIVNDADHTDPIDGPLAQWVVADAAFDNLDACEPVVPYLVTNGNHDVEGEVYQGVSEGFHQFFGVQRWDDAGYTCADPADCDWSAGEWFVGGGDIIIAGRRNNSGEGDPGPSSNQPGRHRAGLIRAPTGQRFLFMGLELAFDFPPPATYGVELDDSRWPKQVLGFYPDVAAIFFHHSMLWANAAPDDSLRWGPQTWASDSLSDPTDEGGGAMEDVWNELIKPFPQALMLFTGHVISPRSQADYTIDRPWAPPVHAFLRNYQVTSLAGDPSEPYGAGWNAIAVFDPEAEEIRVRSYRIDDVDAYTTPPVDYDHDGTPAPTECFDMDQGGVGERVIAWDFQVAGPPEMPSLPPAALAPLVLALMATAGLVLRQGPG